MTKRAKAGRLTVSRLTIHGVLGVDDSTIDLDTITVLEGANATGKSSHLKALRSALGIDRTTLARLVRVPGEDGPGWDEPSVEVLLVGDGREVQVVRRGAGSPEVRERVGEDWRKVPRPVEWLRDLIDVEAANPALWLASDDETRAAAVLAAMPLDGYRREDALRAAGLLGFRLPPIPEELHPLEDLEQVEAAVFSARTEVNRQARAEADAATKLLAGLPAEVPEDPAALVALGEASTTRLAEELARVEEASAAAERSASAAAMARLEAETAKIEASTAAKAAQLKAEYDKAIRGLHLESDRLLREAQAEALVAREEARQRRQEVLNALEVRRRDLAAGRERLAAMREAQRAVETDRHVRATAEEARAKAREHEARSGELGAAIEAIRRYRIELAGRLPVKGLAVAFDEKGRKSLTLDGVPLSQVNDGRLVALATEVSLLRTKPAEDGRPYLPLVLLDGIEKLDPKARAALLREIASRGSQVVAACVGPEAMRTLRGPEALEEAGAR